MLDKIHIDFETRASADLKSAGAWVYSKHPDTQVICMAYCTPKDPEVKLWLPFDPIPDDLVSCIEEGMRVCAHNAFFEYSVWVNIMIPLFGFPDIKDDQWDCTAAKAAYYNLPRALGEAAKALKLPVAKDETGKRVMLRLSKPRKPTKKNPNLWCYEQDRLEETYSYCMDDVRVEKALDESLPDLPEQERQIWLADQKINKRGLLADRFLVESAISLTQQAVAEAEQTLIALTDGEVTSFGQTQRLLKWINNGGTDQLSNLQKAVVQSYLADGMGDLLAGEVLSLREENNKSSTKKYPAFLATMDEDDRVRDILMYSGAITSRWAGKRIQIQNFPRGFVKDVDSLVELINTRDYAHVHEVCVDKMNMPVMAALLSALRSVIIAPEGYELLVVDYASIEARVLAWLAGHTALLDLFANGGKVYEDMAKDIYNIPIEEVTKEQRQIGKQAVLGLGYQMGSPKFKATCAVNGVEIDDIFADRVVKIYRTKNKPISDEWRRQEKAAIAAVAQPKILTRAGRIRWYYDGERFLKCGLPSGRSIIYPFPFLAEDLKFGGYKLKYYGASKGQWVIVDTYGGKLVENIVQGIARDLLAGALVREQDSVVFHVHDEIVAEVPEGSRSLQDFENSLTLLPPWAEGCPLAVEGFVTKRYRK
jgi:DNA polymerase